MSFVQRIRVPLGFVFGALFLYLAQPSPTWFWPGLAVAALGLLLRIWAAGHLVKWKSLAQSGPYCWTRNPLYLGSFFMGIGFSIASGRLGFLILFALLFIAIYWPVMKREEEELRQAYNPDFEIYRRRTPLFFPRQPSRYHSPEDLRRNFDWGRVISNREYKALAGYLALSAILAVKMLWN